MKRKLWNRVAGWANGHTNSRATNVVETAASKLGCRVESCEMQFRVQGVVVFCLELFYLTGANNNYSLCYSSFFHIIHSSLPVFSYCLSPLVSWTSEGNNEISLLPLVLNCSGITPLNPHFTHKQSRQNVMLTTSLHLMPKHGTRGSLAAGSPTSLSLSLLSEPSPLCCIQS